MKFLKYLLQIMMQLYVVAAHDKQRINSKGALDLERGIEPRGTRNSIIKLEIPRNKKVLELEANQKEPNL